MSAVLKLIDFNVIAKAEEWHNKTHKRNLKQWASNPDAKHCPDTVVGKSPIDYASDGAKMKMLNGELWEHAKKVCKKIHPSSETYCWMYTYAHYITQQEFGTDAAGRICEENYDVRGVSNDPKVRDYYQQVIKDLVRTAEAMSK